MSHTHTHTQTGRNNAGRLCTALPSACSGRWLAPTAHGMHAYHAFQRIHRSVPTAFAARARHGSTTRTALTGPSHPPPAAHSGADGEPRMHIDGCRPHLESWPSST